MAVKVGTFQKDVGAAPVAQAIAGVGFPVEALILWTSCQTAVGAWNDHIVYAVGMTDGTRQRSACVALENGVAGGADVGRRWADAALTLYDYNNALLAEAALTSFDADGFTLNWTTNDANAYLIHYLAIGGDDLTDVYLAEWALAAGLGNQSVNTVGFQPDLVIHLGSFLTSTTTENTTAYLGLGAMDGAGNQFAVGIGAVQWLVATGNAANLASACYSVPNGAAIGATLTTVAYVSMDANGFTINKTAAPTTADTLIGSLCLKGGSYLVGNFNEADAIGNQSVGGLGVTPEGVLFFGGVGNNATAHSGNARMFLGAMDTAAQGCSALAYAHAANPSNSKATTRTNAVIAASDGSAPIADEEVAAYVSLDVGGFTINWSVVTSVDCDHGYIVFDTGPYTPPIPPIVAPLSDILFVTRSVGYIALADASGTGRIYRTVDGGYSWHVLPDAYGSMPLTQAVNALAACGVNDIVAGAQGTSIGQVLRLTGK